MGVGMSTGNGEAEKRRQMVIEKEIAKSKEREATTVKLLLLGAAESGKSTVLKQMKILHMNGFSPEEVQMQRGVILNNIIQGMVSMLNAMGELGIRFQRSERSEDMVTIREFLLRWSETDPFPPEVILALLSLWNDEGVRSAFERRNEYQLQDSAKYFLDSMDRIGRSDYVPSLEDILHSRTKTTGIVEIGFVLKQLNFRVFDVGGQRSERKKWIHCFESVQGLLFVTSLSEYNQVLEEDGRTNRMQESRVLFESICNSRWFIKASMIIFFNKTDLFREKLKFTSIKIAFPEYEGPKDFDNSFAFIEQRFEEVKKDTKKRLYKHQTCATDQNQVQLVLNACTDMMVAQNLTEAGIS